MNKKDYYPEKMNLMATEIGEEFRNVFFPWLFGIDETDVHKESGVLESIHELGHESVVPRSLFPDRHMDEALVSRVACDKLKIHPETRYVFES